MTRIVARWTRHGGAAALAALALSGPVLTHAQEATMAIDLRPEPFAIAVPDAVLEDLRARLRATRFAPQVEGSGFEAGMDTAALRGIVDAWAAFDWRAAEARLNALPQFTVTLDGQLIHFVHVESSREAAVPLLLLHGWPSSFVQMIDILPLLAEPPEGEPAFDVVVPSLPGYGFSGIPEEPGMSVGAMAPLMHRLMTEALGYARYGLRSSDLGAGVASAMALAYPEAVIGSHTGGTYPYLPPEIPPDLSPAEERFVADARAWLGSEMAYYQLQSTKPQTVAAALTDSPAGLAAWVGEKFWRWTDNDGRIEDAIPIDGLLTNLTVYWMTSTIGPSMRSYYESARAEGAWGTPTVPVAYLMPVHDMFPTPREWIERQGPVARWTDLPEGGHFLEWEEPEAVAADLRAFFGPLAAE